MENISQRCLAIQYEIPRNLIGSTVSIRQCSKQAYIATHVIEAVDPPSFDPMSQPFTVFIAVGPNLVFTIRNQISQAVTQHGLFRLTLRKVKTFDLLSEIEAIYTIYMHIVFVPFLRFPCAISFILV